MKASEMRKLNDEQLVHTELRLERELVKGTFQHRIGEFKNTARLAALRKDIARLRTIQRERERAANLPSETLRGRFRKTFVVETPVAPATEAAAKPSRGFLGSLVDRIRGT